MAKPQLCILLLNFGVFCAFLNAPIGTAALSIREIGNRFKTMFEPLDNTRVIASLGTHSQEINDKLDAILAAIQKTDTRLDKLERRMELIESSIQDVDS